MPYIITTGTPWGINLGARDKYAVVSRRAVATLEEARQRVFVIAEDVYGVGRDVEAQVAALRSITEQGGTVGPLPDGTVIEVERVSDQDMIRAGRDLHPDDGRLIESGSHDETVESLPIAIAAYNAVQ